MEVKLLDGSCHKVDTLDIALLSQRTELTVPCVYSKDIFWWFAAFVKKQDLNLDQKLIDEWNNQFMAEIMDTDTLHDLIMLAWRTGQWKLLDVCCQRVADGLKVCLDVDVAELLNLPYDGDGDEGDENDEDGDEGGDEDDNDPLPEVPDNGGGNDDMDGDIPSVSGEDAEGDPSPGVSSEG